MVQNLLQPEKDEGLAKRGFSALIFREIGPFPEIIWSQLAIRRRPGTSGASGTFFSQAAIVFAVEPLSAAAA